MKKQLTKQDRELYFYNNNGVRKIVNYQDKSTYPKNISGDISSKLSGNISELFGDISGLSGNISNELSGNISGLSGEISGIKGICTNIQGNLDDCEITEKEREAGINIEELVKI